MNGKEMKSKKSYIYGGLILAIILLIALLVSCSGAGAKNKGETAAPGVSTQADQGAALATESHKDESPASAGTQEAKADAQESDMTKPAKESLKETETQPGEDSQAETKEGTLTESQAAQAESETEETESRSAENTDPSHTHVWVAVTGTVRHPAEVKTIYHEAVTHTVHHPAKTHTVHHPAETRTVYHPAVTHTVHHPEEGHHEDVLVVISEAWDEPVYETHSFCNRCGLNLTIEMMEGRISAYTLHGLYQHPEEGSGWYSAPVQVGTIHHEAVTETRQIWVVDRAAWDETIVDKEAWTETVTVKEAWEETVVDQAAWDETIVDKEAWTETVTVKEAWEESVTTGYKCSCGEEKAP